MSLRRHGEAEAYLCVRARARAEHAGGGGAQDPMQISGLGRPQNAQEWKELVQLSVQASMTTATTLRTLLVILTVL